MTEKCGFCGGTGLGYNVDHGFPSDRIFRPPEEGEVYVERCDCCDMFKDDHSAAFAYFGKVRFASEWRAQGVQRPAQQFTVVEVSSYRFRPGYFTKGQSVFFKGEHGDDFYVEAVIANPEGESEQIAGRFYAVTNPYTMEICTRTTGKGEVEPALFRGHQLEHAVEIKDVYVPVVHPVVQTAEIMNTAKKQKKAEPAPVPAALIGDDGADPELLP